MALFPIMSNFERDFVVQLVPVDTEDTMDQVAEKCAYHSLNRRVVPREDKVLRVRKHETGELYPRDMKVADAGLRPTETLDIVYMDS
ncbi:toluene-4-monooxygenase system B family protein [Thiolapillus brandeum]|uniref:Toluene-4-monooxygenase system protein B n=1 Tax=Thiolapillus brandeum TaxID=1076588 RepID=A0A7U6GHN7_9GAMM|nr:toluene-4-monooxygenase system B family protein [Thiolapillus brandeum]BAO43849.1 toluene-4-monooxygenase system protein B [Thiolapillus brandeum]